MVMANTQPSVDFLRLMSDESNASDLTIVFCDDHQEALFEQSCTEGASQKSVEGPSTGENIWYPMKKWDPSVPLRNLPLSMEEKRDIRDQWNLQRHTIGCWEAWRRSQQTMRRRMQEHILQSLSALQLWGQALHAIEGKFGMNVKVYFVFLRYLVYLNLFHCLLIVGLIQAPVFIFRGNETYSGSKQTPVPKAFHLLQGILENSPVFYGFYLRGTLDGICLNTPILFLLGVSSVLIFSLVLVVRRTANGYKHKWMLGIRYSFNVSFKIFCGWDFCIQDPKSAAFKQSYIKNDLKMDLEEKWFQMRKSQRTLKQQLKIHVLRFVLNLVVVVLLGSAFCFIYFATLFSQVNKTQKHSMLSLLVQYLPPITITLVNFLLPHIFRIIAGFEDYSLTSQVNITLCWENHFGQEMYKLLMFDFFATLVDTFLIMLPRKLLSERYPECFLLQAMGRQRFLVPLNVLDLVYTQTVMWVGLFYCPMLAQICVIKLFAIFYIKKFAVYRCCEPTQRMFRASASLVLFHFVLLLGVFMAFVVLGINLNKLQPSSSCGPFVGSITVFNVTVMCVDSLPSPSRDIIHFFSSEAFALALILAEILFLTSSVSHRNANKKCIQRLKDMLVMCSSDKLFLVKQHSLWLQDQRGSEENPVGSPTDTRDRSPPTTPKGRLGFQPPPERSISQPYDTERV
ncbi:transmembrane channel-like protein 7 isoform X2 [Arapaima gigas]